MSEKLPNFIDPVLLAERRSVVSGEISIVLFDRLADLVADNIAMVSTELAFFKEGKRAVIAGSIKTVLTLVCQSCLQTLLLPIDVTFKLGVVSSLQEVEQLEIDCEPLLFNGEKIPFNTIIEDEILLALPDYPKHDYPCIKQTSSKNSDYHEQDKRIEADNPFSVLAKLKNTGD